MNITEIAALDTRISDTLSEYSEQHSDPDMFESGHCAELALAACMLGADLRLPTEITILMRKAYHEDDGLLFDTTFSHCVADVDGCICDIQGASADKRWIDKWPKEPCEHGLISEF